VTNKGSLEAVIVPTEPRTGVKLIIHQLLDSI